MAMKELDSQNRAWDFRALRLADELKVTIGRGYSKRNLEQYRKFYKLYQNIAQTPSALSWPPDESGQSTRTLLPWLLEHFTLSWSHTALEQRRDKTRQIKPGIMQQLLSGRVRLV